MRLRLIVTLGLFFAIARPAHAAPIVVGSEIYDLTIDIATSLVIAPGETAFVTATLQNTGTLAITFKPWDPALPIGGYGWDFNDPGFAIGSQGLNFTNNNDWLVVNAGQSAGGPHTPDFSLLGGVTLNAGEQLLVDLWSFSLASDVAVGTSGTVRTASQIDAGAPVYQGWDTDSYTVTWTAGAINQAGASTQRLTLTEFGFLPDTQHVPEPGSGWLLCFGAAVMHVASRVRASDATATKPGTMAMPQQSRHRSNP